MKTAFFLVTFLLFPTLWARVETLHHDYGQVLGLIAIDNACITPTEVRSIKPVHHCTQLEQVQHKSGDYSWVDWVCRNFEDLQVSNPRAFERTVCAESTPPSDKNPECLRWVQQPDFLPATIPVRIVVEDGDNPNYFGTPSTFTFPECK